MRERRNKRLLLAGVFAAALLTACGGEDPAPVVETETPAPEPVPTLLISELMSVNKSTLMDEAGGFPDWIELHNISAETVELSGWTISGAALPERSLEPGGYALLLCSESGAGQN